MDERLIERAPRGLHLTAAGEVVADYVNGVLRGLNRMQGALDELRGLQRGHLTIGAIPSAAVELLPRVLSAFRRAHPRITLDCRFLGSPEIMAHLAAGEMDVGLCFNPPAVHALRQLISVPLPFGAVMSPDCEFAGRQTLRLYDLVDAGVPLIFPDESNSLRPTLDRLLSKSQLDALPAITTLNRDFMVGMAVRGAGVAFQTPVGIERELRDGLVRFVPILEPRLAPERLTVLVPARPQPSAIASLAAEAIRAAVAELLK